MISADQVRALAAALPETEDGSSAARLVFGLRGKGFAWSWMERAAPKTPRKPRLDVLAVRCRAEEKAMILEADPDLFVHDPHYDGYPALLVRLDRIEPDYLAALLKVAWLCQAPRALLKALGHEA